MHDTLPRGYLTLNAEGGKYKTHISYALVPERDFWVELEGITEPADEQAFQDIFMQDEDVIAKLNEAGWDAREDESGPLDQYDTYYWN
jgi:hypothetical protein